ncbi:MAG: sugar ABC transporter ATP-binding protein [Nocardioidaceae bacterium]
MTFAPAVLRLEAVSKSFGATAAVRGVSLDVHPGEVHCLLGENGAGKSTLIKMVAGVHTPDHGRVLVDGRPVQIRDARTAERLGIATIHQELALVPNMTVAENVLLGRLPRRFGLVRRADMGRLAAEALDRIGLDVSPDRRLGSLGVARQQLVEIAKALSLDARVLVLDEPTAALTGHETQQLFTVMRQLRAAGVAMVFISHHLDEIAAIGDRVTVLRDGVQVAERPADAARDELVRLMVGRDIDHQYPTRRTPDADADGDAVGEPVLEVRGLTRSGAFQDVSFTLRPGEVVGLAGLVGAGRTEVVRAVAGADRYDNGVVLVHGEPIPRADVAAAVRAGIGHIPEDRKDAGLVLGASVDENLGYATMSSTSRWGLVDARGQRRRTTEIADRLRVRRRSMDQPVRSLSGGNQQKVVFGRWVLADSTVLLLDEPTRGVDVGAKVEIYDLINTVSQAGGAVLLVSSELPEVLGMSDRVLVMAQGRLVGELAAEEAVQDAVMELATKEVESTRAH